MIQLSLGLNFYLDYKMKILVICSLVWSVSFAQSGPKTLSEAEMMIADLKKEISEEETRWAEEKARDTESEKKRKDRFLRFKNEKIALKKDLKVQEERVRVTMSKISQAEVLRKNWENKLEALEGQLQRSSESYVLRLDKGFPFELEKRQETAKLLVSDIRQDKSEPEAAFLRLDNAYNYEHRLAQDASVKAKPIKVASREVEAKYARIGKQVLLYASGNGEYVGILNKTPEGDYVWVNQENLEYDKRQALRDAIAVAEGKALPGFVIIPVWRETFEGMSSFDVNQPIVDTTAVEAKESKNEK